MGEFELGKELSTDMADVVATAGILDGERIIHPNAALEAYFSTGASKVDLPDVIDAESLARAREEVEATFKGAGLVVETVSEVAARVDARVAEAVTPAEKKPLGVRLLAKRDAIKQDLSLHLRGAREEDIDQLVTVDLKTFDSVYKDRETSEEELRAELTGMFTERYEMLGGQWIRVLEKDGKLLGCIVACPTSKPPEDFISWEDTTDNGTLKTTYDPQGKYLYVVSLSAMPEISGAGGGDMLMANMIGRIIGGDYHAYFESRVPGLKRWVMNQCRPTKTKLANLTEEQLDAYAEEYFGLEVEKDGKQVPIDPLLRMYDSMGCSFVKIVADAYQDSLSLNYGVVCQYDNPLPDLARRIPFVRRAAGGLIGLVSHSNLLTQKAL